LVGKPEGKRQLGRPMPIWEENVKMDLRKIGWGGGLWTVCIWLRIRTSGGTLLKR
jgi:hypothetical protein